MTTALRTVWKFDLQPGMTVLPPLHNPKVLTVAVQPADPRIGGCGGGLPVVYVEHEPEPVGAPGVGAASSSSPTGTVLRLYSTATGGYVPPDAVEYVGTVVGVEGWMTFHVYRLTTP